MQYHKKLLCILCLLAAACSSYSIENPSSYCTDLERDFTFIPISRTAALNFTEDFIKTLNKCSPPIQDKQYYHNVLLSALNQRSSDDKIEVIISASQMIADSIPELPRPSSNLSAQNFPLFIEYMNQNDLFIEIDDPESVIPSKNKMRTRHTVLSDTDFTVVSLYADINTSFLLCQNSENIEYIIHPLLNWVNQRIIEAFSISSFSNPHLFQSLRLIRQNTDSSIGNSFLTQVYSRHLDFIIENLPSGSYEDLLSLRFLQPLQKWTAVRGIYDEKLRESCLEAPLSLREFIVQEDYYRIQDSSIPLPERRNLFQKLHRDLKESPALVFYFKPNADYTSFYRFRIKLP